MKLLWAPIQDFPNYSVSNTGIVRNILYSREVTPRRDSYGYLRVSLHNSMGHTDRLVHHLVAQAFMSGWYKGVSIRHVDHDKTNNSVLNIRFKANRGLGRYIAEQPEVTERHLRIVETGARFRSVAECAKALDTTSKAIYRVLEGDRYSHLGYTYEWVRERLEDEETTPYKDV